MVPTQANDITRYILVDKPPIPDFSSHRVTYLRRNM